MERALTASLECLHLSSIVSVKLICMRGEEDVSIGALTSWTCACFSLGQSNFLAMSTLPEQVDKKRSREHTASVASVPGSSCHTRRLTKIHRNHANSKHTSRQAREPKPSQFVFKLVSGLGIFHTRRFLCLYVCVCVCVRVFAHLSAT